MATKSNTGKHQVGGWLSSEEKADFTKSLQALGQRSVADLLRRISGAHKWTRARREAFLRLIDPESDPTCEWVFVRMDRETSIKLHALAARWILSPEAVAESLIKTGVVRPDSDEAAQVLSYIQTIQEGDLLTNTVIGDLKRRIEQLEQGSGAEKPKQSKGKAAK